MFEKNEKRLIAFVALSLSGVASKERAEFARLGGDVRRSRYLRNERDSFDAERTQRLDVARFNAAHYGGGDGRRFS